MEAGRPFEYCRSWIFATAVGTECSTVVLSLVLSELRRVRPKHSGNTPFGIASCSCEAQPRQVVGIKGGDVVLLCRRYEFLCLHNLDGIRDAGSKPVTCLTQCVLSENTITFRNHDLLVGCIEPKKCVANLEVDTPAYVFVLSAPLRGQRLPARRLPEFARCARSENQLFRKQRTLHWIERDSRR